MEVQFKETQSSPSQTLEYAEFKAKIRRGEIGPKNLVCDRVLTNGEWWNLDELNIFHNNSPVEHPLGPNLEAKRRTQRLRQEAEKRSFTNHIAYTHGDLLEREYRLTPLPELLSTAGTIGVTRLFVLQSFQPERVFDFVFSGAAIRIAAVQGRTSLWYSLPQVSSTNGLWQEKAGRPFDPEAILRDRAELSYAPRGTFAPDWRALERLAHQAQTCSSRACDGVGYRHFLLTHGLALTAEWLNPWPGAHDPQLRLLEMYRQLVVAAGLERFWHTHR